MTSEQLNEYFQKINYTPKYVYKQQTSFDSLNPLDSYWTVHEESFQPIGYGPTKKEAKNNLAQRLLSGNKSMLLNLKDNVIPTSGKAFSKFDDTDVFDNNIQSKEKRILIYIDLENCQNWFLTDKETKLLQTLTQKNQIKLYGFYGKCASPLTEKQLNTYKKNCIELVKVDTTRSDGVDHFITSMFGYNFINSEYNECLIITRDKFGSHFQDILNSLQSLNILKDQKTAYHLISSEECIQKLILYYDI